MNTRLLLVAIGAETDIVLVRKRTRRLAELIGFEGQDQTRITTAVSEIARNAFEYAGGGQIEFRLTGDAVPQSFVIVVSDRGPGIADLPAVLSGSHKSATGMGIGLLGAQRLMDELTVETRPDGGTTVRLTKLLPPRAPLITPSVLKRIAGSAGGGWSRRRDGGNPPAEPADPACRWNSCGTRQEELERLNQELQDTNRGVVALYAELDERADHLRRADELKSKFLSHMSHEFRTPLNSILALSRLLLSRSDGDLTAEQETQVRFVRKAAENLTELVDDLLDLAKVEAGKTVGHAVGIHRRCVCSVRCAACCGRCWSAMPSRWCSRSRSTCRRWTPTKARCRRSCATSSPTRSSSPNAARCGCAPRRDRDADTVTFSVRDTGIGIAPGDLESDLPGIRPGRAPLAERA